ncbi:ubiquinol-cytochrome C chaperone family protein [Xanthobacter sp. TB0139]|uniref:ubiquinol-cytochrome C chaperone family protein n=1 Tax=Xanthobacter sp. TB0139 TaxID=3459178 RepID=UPI00403A6913
MGISPARFLSAMFKFFSSAKNRAIIERLYGAIVAQSRQPVFYTEFSIPDTREGRFELVVLHTVLLCHRLKGGDKLEKSMSQDIFDAFADDMDRTLREMGVGDLSVPKRMKKIGAAFYGRAAAYDAGLAAQDNTILAQALARNMLDSEDSAPVEALAVYVRAAAMKLRETSFSTLAQGDLPWPAPDQFQG